MVGVEGLALCTVSVWARCTLDTRRRRGHAGHESANGKMLYKMLKMYG